ncbi:winged helix-turn-helix domain-containing protein [Pseudonocardia sp. KRD-184]|uniref:Winged helix-turn-helix domain-containing protein n=1 Tax=Pseudonocardia oceani TaxID=2792013 RepID=A0ABS6UH56_9PSEU|nr:BTAD domain-containing putative transcriptional regulator [Pseudonocardia oceani]MBW0091779.1 winged helix-turn-helix domain-containing protein [Pseudonocardia oceani]MBW0097784.1 winged helix-turn-helix domain-containing protein [Pseudonocardia oceani]MBW0110374.1 winged helix-turn-helix domain-containing protein [Pseudonocardia oceani]MBW0124510.1 winged helix-turn-helix domain-containing protein [Pseudonocardia oceani]MBW0131587.1 winged helix-turn-helix domain-containing protein [Pseudo
MDATAVGVLGPLLVLAADAVPVPVPSGRQRRLLTALALHAGADVGVDVLADLVWGDDQPADPDGALQTNVARLRRLLPPGVRVTTGPRCYRLDAPVDAVVFAGLLERPTVSLADLDAALALWRGRPYAELDDPGPAAARLVALHSAAAARRADALLAAGRSDDAVAAAAALLAVEPLHEGAAATLMRAQAAGGRPAEALRVYARFRAELAEQLGADPSPELARLHERLLRDGERPRPALPVSAFLGRDADVTRAAAMLTEHRLVTLCGPGGVGKTRLARHVAASLADRFDDGALLVDLVPATPDTVAGTVAAALRLAAGDGLRARIVEVLATRRQLLVLDNCEHVADPVAALVEAVVAGAPGVVVLATSREALRADGEHVLPLAPLAPAPAAALLVDRIGAADPVAVPDPEQVAVVCARLDGLPLALELAAARVGAVGLPGLLAALDDPLDALGRGRRTAPLRHRSLRDVVEWSYGLLDDDERTLFVRLGVFAGAVEAGAVAAVCGDARVLPDLVDRSLVRRRDGDPVTFGMLETLRAFCRSLLATDPGFAALQARHAAWVVALAVDTLAARSRPDEAAAVRRFDAHLADIGRAHAWLCTAGPTEDLLRLAHVCAELGYQRARADLAALAEDALAVAGTAHPLVPRVLALTAMPLWQRGDLRGARERCVRALGIADRLGDALLGGEAHDGLANVALAEGDLVGAAVHAGRSADLAAAADDDVTRVMALCDLAITAAYAGDDATAGRHEEACTALASRMGSPLALGWAAYAAGERRAESGQDGAAEHLERAVALAEEVDAAFLAGVARHTLLTTAARAGARSPASFAPLLDAWIGMGAWTQLWVAMRALAEVLSRHGRHRDATVLLGALRASPRAGREYGADAGRVLAVEDAARTALGEGYAPALAEGAALGDAGAVTLARRLVR